MKNKYIYLAILCVHAISIPLLSAEESVESYAFDFSNIPIEKVNKNNLPEGVKGKEKEFFRHLRADGGALKHLLRLDDQVTIDQLIKIYKEKEGAGMAPTLGNLAAGVGVSPFWTCKSPYVLDELSEGLYQAPSTIKYRRNGYPYMTYDYGYAAVTARVMIRIVETTPEFSEETRKQAKKLTQIMCNRRRGLPLVVKDVADIIQWWEANKEACLENRFQDVTPPPADKIEKRTAYDLKKLRDQKRAQATKSHIRLPKKEKKQKQEITKPESTSSNKIIILSAIFTVIVLLFIKIKAKSAT